MSNEVKPPSNNPPPEPAKDATSDKVTIPEPIQIAVQSPTTPPQSTENVDIQSDAPKKKGERHEPFGRPSIWSQEKADELCLRLSNGETFRAICSDEHMPSRITVFNWLNPSDPTHKPNFLTQVNRARAMQAHAWVDQIIEIADDDSNDFVTEADGRVRVNHEHVQRSRLKVETRWRIISKRLSSEYGEKPTVAVEIHNDNRQQILVTPEVAQRLQERRRAISMRERPSLEPAVS